MIDLHGENIIARSISAGKIKDQYRNVWQYHSRSDRHSKISCWAIMFDLLQQCTLLRNHVEQGKVAFGINHELRDFRHNRKKNLDLVLCTGKEESVGTFRDYGEHNGVCVTSEEARMLSELPILCRASVSNVLIALEAKACMTEHVKALPRLHDELSSSHQTIHGDTSGAIAAGYVIINSANSFISPDRNRRRIRAGKAIVNAHKQPHVTAKTLEAILKLSRRTSDQDHGFDAFGVSILSCHNDGSPVVIDETGNKEVPGIVNYKALIHRLAHLYATKYTGL